MICSDVSHGPCSRVGASSDIELLHTTKNHLYYISSGLECDWMLSVEDSTGLTVEYDGRQHETDADVFMMPNDSALGDGGEGKTRETYSRERERERETQAVQFINQ